MKIEIKVELDGLEMEKFEAKIEAALERDSRLDDYSRYVAAMEHDAWLDWWAARNAWMIGN